VTLLVSSHDWIGLTDLCANPPAGTEVHIVSSGEPSDSADAGMTVAVIEILPHVDIAFAAGSIARGLLDRLSRDAGPIRIADWTVSLQSDALGATLRAALRV